MQTKPLSCRVPLSIHKRLDEHKKATGIPKERTLATALDVYLPPLEEQSKPTTAKPKRGRGK